LPGAGNGLRRSHFLTIPLGRDRISKGRPWTDISAFPATVDAVPAVFPVRSSKPSGVGFHRVEA